MTAPAPFGDAATSMPAAPQVSPRAPMNSRPQSTGGPFDPSTESMPATAADHLEPLPQPPVHERSAASFIETDVSRTITIFGGTRSAGSTAPQPLSGYPAVPVAGPTPAVPSTTEPPPPLPPTILPPNPDTVAPPAPVRVPRPALQPAPPAPAATRTSTA